MRGSLFVMLWCLISLCSYSQTWEEYMQASSRYRMYGNDSCFIMIDKAIEIAPDVEKRGLSKIYKGATYMRFARWDEGIDHLNKVIREDSLFLSNSLKARAFNALAILYEGEESFDDQVFNAQRALDFALIAMDTAQLIDAYTNLLRASSRLGKADEAINYGMIAMDHALVFKDKIKLYKVAHNLFSPNIDIIDEEPIADYLIQFIERTKPKELPTDGYHTGFQFLEQYNIGLEQWKSLYEKLALNDSPFLSSLGIRYSHALQESGLFNKALEVNDALYASTLGQGDPVSAKILTLMSYQILKKQNKYLDANQYLERFYSLKDSLQSVEVQNNVNALNIKFETARKDQEIAEQEIELLESQKQRNYLIVGILGLLFFGSFIVFTLIGRHAYQKQLAHREQEIQFQKIQKLQQKQKIVALDYMLMGEENERKRIAKDLHDSLGAQLASVKLQLKKLHQDIEGISEISLFQKTEAMLENAAQDVRRISHDMMPDALVNLGLSAAIEDLTNNINEGGNLQANAYFFDVEEAQLTDQQKVGIYRIVQELSQNVLKHAQAAHMVIQLSQEDYRLKLEVEDDGIGFDPINWHESDGIGLKNIDSRIKYLDGALQINSKPGGPTSFTVTLPLEDQG